MRKAKRHMNFSAEFVTPEQKLEEISFLEDHKYNFGSWTNRCKYYLIKKPSSMAGLTKII